MAACSHTDSIELTELPTSVEGCQDCLREGTGWVHLRICLQCGHVGCCDSSPRRHASAHFRATEHPIMRSLEPEEDWCWCFLDETVLALPQVHGETETPRSPLLG